MPNLGFSELIIVLLIIVVVFGSTKLPQLGDGLGRAIKNFKRAVTNQNEIEVSPKATGKGEISDNDAPAGAASAAEKSSKTTG
jgi:sec-independent protein translocase protein TatA